MIKTAAVQNRGYVQLAESHQQAGGRCARHGTRRRQSGLSSFPGGWSWR